MNRLLIILLAGWMLLSACADEDGPFFLTTHSGAAAEMDGTWASCVSLGGSSMWMSISGQGTGYTINMDSHFGVADCSTSPDLTSDQAGTVHARGPVDAWLGVEQVPANRIAAVPDSHEVAIHNAGLVATYNTAHNGKGYYGITDWVAGQARSVLGYTEEGYVKTYPARNLIYFDDRITPVRLHTGDENAPWDEYGYPTYLVDLFYLTKSP